MKTLFAFILLKIPFIFLVFKQLHNGSVYF